MKLLIMGQEVIKSIFFVIYIFEQGVNIKLELFAFVLKAGLFYQIPECEN